MRLSNRNKIGYFEFLPIFLVVLLVCGILAFFFDQKRFNILGSEKYLLILVPILLLWIFYLRGRQIFEYDSDGEALNFKNRNSISFLGKVANDEFPKYKFLKFEIFNALIFKRLYVTINSKKSHAVVLRYDISYLTAKELRDLKLSLNKVLKTNKEYKENKDLQDN